MKTYLFMLAISTLSILTASAQDDRNWRNDPTYSTHNYKHPNKAATARQWETKSGVVVQPPKGSQGPLANYKHPVPGALSQGGVVVAHTPAMGVAVRNYKDQRIPSVRSASQPASVVADQVSGQPSPEGN
jgi:hypothetical protein